MAKLNKKQLQAELKKLKVEFDPKANNADLEKLLAKSQKKNDSEKPEGKADGKKEPKAKEVKDESLQLSKKPGDLGYLGGTPILAIRDKAVNGKVYNHIELSNGTTMLLNDDDFDSQRTE